MVTDLTLEDAVDLSRNLRREFGKVREVYVSEFVLREMREKGAEDLGLNRCRLIDPEADGRVYEHKIEYKKGVFTCWSENKI